jgi:hypothetical protein
MYTGRENMEHCKENRDNDNRLSDDLVQAIRDELKHIRFGKIVLHVSPKGVMLKYTTRNVQWSEKSWQNLYNPC